MDTILTPIRGDFKAEASRRLELLKYAADSQPLQEMLFERWKRDPIAFISDCLWIFDPRDDKGWKSRPMVPWDAQETIINLFLGRLDKSRNPAGKIRPVICRKSRDQGGTYIMVGCILWDWLFNGGHHGVMCRAGYQLDGGGHNSIFGKLDYALSMLPLWLVPWRNIEKIRSKKPLQIMHPITEALIMGCSTTEGGWRGSRMNTIWVDEAAWVGPMDSVLTSIFGACDTVILISSVAGKGNTFYQIDAGESGYKTFDIGEGESGWIRCELHYRDDPYKTIEWIENKKAEMPPAKWAQEFECDYSASAPGRIWPEFDSGKHVLPKTTWSQIINKADQENWLIYEGWDFGVSSLTASVWATYDASRDIIYIIDSMSWKEARIDTIARDVGMCGFSSAFNLQGITPNKRLGDPAGKNRDSMLTSPILNLSKYGIKVDLQPLKGGDGIRDLIRLKISQNKLLFSPRANKRRNKDLPSIVECVEQYRTEKDTPVPKKDIYSHASDALQYIAASIWGKIPSIGTLYEQGP